MTTTTLSFTVVVEIDLGTVDPTHLRGEIEAALFNYDFAYGFERPEDTGQICNMSVTRIEEGPEK